MILKVINFIKRLFGFDTTPKSVKIQELDEKKENIEKEIKEINEKDHNIDDIISDWNKQ